jgi:hypothetical protein
MRMTPPQLGLISSRVHLPLSPSSARSCARVGPSRVARLYRAPTFAPLSHPGLRSHPIRTPVAGALSVTRGDCRAKPVSPEPGRKTAVDLGLQ